MTKSFKLWRSQSIQDLKSYRKMLEAQKIQAIQPLDETIRDIDRLIHAMQGEEITKAVVTSSPKVTSSSPLRKGTNKGYRYPKGTHWTQLPENKERVRELALKKAKARRMNS